MTLRPESDTLAEVWAFLLERGVSADDIHRAERDNTLHLLVTEHIVLPDPPRYTAPQMAEMTGIPLDDLRHYWRSLGFPDVSDDEVVFGDYDLEALITLTGLIQFRMVDEQIAMQMARVMGSSMARIAEAGITASPVLHGAGDDVARAELLMHTADATLPSLARLIEYVWRRHLQAAARRGMLLNAVADAPTATLAVGFADLVGFTALSQQLSERALAELVDHFEALAFDVVVRGGGRVVKMIGDEAMFVVDDPAAAVHIGLDLAEAHANEDSLGEVRVGIAHGPVLTREGDYFGPVVNMASRIVNIARPGSVVVSDSVHEAVGTEDGTVDWKSLRPRYLKDIGRVPLWVVTMAGQPQRERRWRIL